MLFQVQILAEIQIHVVHQIKLHVTSNKHCLHRAQNPDLTFWTGCNIIIAHISHTGLEEPKIFIFRFSFLVSRLWGPCMCNMNRTRQMIHDLWLRVNARAREWERATKSTRKKIIEDTYTHTLAETTPNGKHICSENWKKNCSHEWIATLFGAKINRYHCPKCLRTRWAKCMPYRIYMCVYSS